MKFSKLLMSVLSASIFFIGCSSTKIPITDYNSIAVVGITGNKNLSEQVDTTQKNSDVEDVDDTSLLSTLVDKFLHGENPELLTGQDRIDYAEEYFRQALEEIAGLKVASKDQVISSEEYKKSNISPLSFVETWTSATGFEKNLYSIGAKKARLLMKELGTNSLVTAEFRFNKLFDDDSKVKTNVRAQVMMDVIFYDSNGSKCYYEHFESTSLEKIPVRKFDYDKEALIAQYPSVIENVINLFILKHM